MHDQRVLNMSLLFVLPPLRPKKGGAVWFGEKEQERFQGTIEGIGRRSPGPVCEEALPLDCMVVRFLRWCDVARAHVGVS